MDEEVVIHIYNVILLNHKMEQISVIWTKVNEITACYMEWSKSGREKQILCINTYIWNIEKWFDEPTCSAGIDTDIENGLVNTVGEGDGGTDWESSIEIDNYHV